MPGRTCLPSGARGAAGDDDEAGETAAGCDMDGRMSEFNQADAARGQHSGEQAAAEAAGHACAGAGEGAGIAGTPAWQGCAELAEGVGVAEGEDGAQQQQQQQAVYAQLHCAMDADDQQFVIGGQVRLVLASSLRCGFVLASSCLSVLASSLHCLVVVPRVCWCLEILAASASAFLYLPHWLCTPQFWHSRIRQVHTLQCDAS